MNSQPHILIIEDDLAVAESLAAGLERERFIVTHKETGRDGMNYAKESYPHLILLDLRLPDGSGFDFCREMRQAGIHQPILILTAQHEELDKVLGLEIGADDYITKPYSLRELVSRIRAHLRRSYGEFSNHETCLLYFGEICIDLTRSQALRKEKPLDLTPIEFRLLTYLAQNGNRTVSRSQIINEVWGYTPDLNSEKTVNVHIRHLREKIEDDPESPTIIVTAPGIGYRLNTFLVD